jgi:hypothetical protein
VNDIKEETLLICHRIFVLILGLSTGTNVIKLFRP